MKKRIFYIVPALLFGGFFFFQSKPEPKTATQARPLSREEQARFEAGKALFAVSCASCHQPHGMGQEGLAPPLVNTEWVTGSEERLARILLQGLRGPISIQGITYRLEMPSVAIFDDEQLAALMTYTRREWGHAASAVEPAKVARVRNETASRDEPWTEAELLKIP